jgi:16S rRNA G966 N2-methylase RsmD
MDSNNPTLPKGKYKPDFDFKKIQINDVGRYSITRPYEAKQIIVIIKETLKLINMKSENCIITDGTSGVGGDTIHFSKYFKFVNAVDILEENTELLRNNCEMFGITNVNIIHADFVNVIDKIKQDILYIDPPWGGIGYKDKDKVELMMSGIPIHQILKKLNSAKSPLIFIKLPLNADMSNLNVKKTYTILNKKNTPSFYIVHSEAL